MNFTVTIPGNANKTHGHDGGARRPDNHQGGAHHNRSVFGPKPNFSPNASRNHGRDHGLEFGKNERFEGHHRANRHHRHHGGSERFAPEYQEAPKGSFLSKLIGPALGLGAGLLLGKTGFIGGAIKAVGGFLGKLFH